MKITLRIAWEMMECLNYIEILMISSREEKDQRSNRDKHWHGGDPEMPMEQWQKARNDKILSII